MVRAWIMVLVFTFAVVSYRSLYRPDFAAKSELELQVQELALNSVDSATIKDKISDGKVPVESVSQSSPAHADIIRQTLSELEIAKTMPESRERDTLIIQLTDRMIHEEQQAKERQQILDEVSAESPEESMRKLLKVELSPLFSPVNASHLYADPFSSPVALSEDLLKDPRVEKLYRVLTDPTHPDFEKTYQTLLEEAQKYIGEQGSVATSETSYRALAPGAGVALPILIASTPAQTEHIQILSQMQQTLEESNKFLNNGSDEYTQSDMSKMLAFSIENVFTQIINDEGIRSTLSMQQQNVVTDVEAYLSDRRKLTADGLDFLESSNFIEVNPAESIANDQIDGIFWQFPQFIGSPATPMPSATIAMNVELIMFDFAQSFTSN